MATRIKEKAKARRENKDTRPRATAKYIRMSSRKVKAVLDLIRGKSVGEAMAILENTNRAAVEPIKNAELCNCKSENNLEMSRDTLYVAETFANQVQRLRKLDPVLREEL